MVRYWTIVGCSCIAFASAFAQSARMCIHINSLGPSYAETRTDRLDPTAPDAPHYLRLDVRRDYSGSMTHAVRVSLYFTLTDRETTPGVNIINSFIRMDDGLRVYEGFDQDEAGFNTDDRKNAHSHASGDSEVDGAGNALDYLDNSIFWWERNGDLSGPAAFGKSSFINEGFSGTDPTPLYSFVVLVPKREGRYRLYLDRVFSGGTPNVDETVKTNVLSLAEPDTVQFELQTCDALIEVVPEPSSLLALGVGLLFVNRFRRGKA